MATLNPIQLSLLNREIIPKGQPNFKILTQFPSIKKLCEQHGEAALMKIISVLIKDYCESVNVVRNMSGPQILDAASFLLDECDTCRLEDYQIMFFMAKRGHFKINDGKGIMDRLDITIITQIFNAYMNIRAEEGIKLRDERENELRMQRLNNTQKQIGGENIVIPEGYFDNELRKLRAKENEARNERWEEFKSRASERKKQLMQEAADSWGVSVEEMFNKMGEIPDREKEELPKVEPKEGQIVNLPEPFYIKKKDSAT